MADKYVKLNDIIDTLENEWGYEGMREDLQSLPAADVQEVRRGEWKYEGEYKACSHCGTFVEWNTLGTAYWNYCPCCGAKNDGGNK